MNTGINSVNSIKCKELKSIIIISTLPVMRAFIRAVSLLSIGIYLLFSQFVVKALVTTAIPPESRGEAGCVMKNLDTFD